MKRVLFAGLLLLALSGCNTTRPSDAHKLALYQANAGAPVDSFQYFVQLNGWTPLGDSALAVWTKPNQAYLLELSGPCQDLTFASAISISNMMGRVSARFDNVEVRATGIGGPHMPCRISTIRPLDLKGLREGERELRDAKAVDRAPSAG